MKEMTRFIFLFFNIYFISCFIVINILISIFNSVFHFSLNSKLFGFTSLYIISIRTQITQ